MSKRKHTRGHYCPLVRQYGVQSRISYGKSSDAVIASVNLLSLAPCPYGLAHAAQANPSNPLTTATTDGVGSTDTAERSIAVHSTAGADSTDIVEPYNTAAAGTLVVDKPVAVDKPAAGTFADGFPIPAVDEHHACPSG